MRAPQVADFCAAAWQDFTPPLTGLQINLAQGLRAADVPLTIFKHQHFENAGQAVA